MRRDCGSGVCGWLPITVGMAPNDLDDDDNGSDWPEAFLWAVVAVCVTALLITSLLTGTPIVPKR